MTVDPSIIGRIRKLFALARDKGATEAEAATALEKANDLLLSHNLSADAVTDKAAESVTEQGVRLGRRESWRHRLVVCLARHNLCDCFYDADRVVIVGRPTNIAVTREMFDWTSPQLVLIAEQEYREYLVEIVATEEEHEGQTYCPDCDQWRSDDETYRGECDDCGTRVLATSRVHGKTWKINFMRGMIGRIKNRLYEQREAQKSPAAVVTQGAAITALVLVTNKAIEDYNKRHHPDLVSRRRRDSGFHAGAYRRGAVRANDISLGGNRLDSSELPRLGGSQ